MGSSNSRHDIPKDAYGSDTGYSSRYHSTNVQTNRSRTHIPATTTSSCEGQNGIYTTPNNSTNVNRATTCVPATPTSSTSKQSNVNPSTANTFMHDNTTSGDWNILSSHSKEKESKKLNVPSVPSRKPRSSTISFLTNVAIPPEKFKSMEDFLKRWPVWKEQFISYINLVDEKKLKCDLWGSMLLNLMGSVRREISSEFAVDDVKNKDSYLVLIAKLDAYYSFYAAERRKGENIDKYVDRLKGMNFSNNAAELLDALKKKILQEIDSQCKNRFIIIASSIMFDFKYSYISQLSLKEIIQIWKMCEESMSNIHNNEKEDCDMCGKNHDINNCFAATLECNKCRERGHIASMCPLSYINNCQFCGGKHKKNRNKCPAYGEICSKCHKLNHFTWKCHKVTYIKDCNFCGLNHAANRNDCAAKTARCSICKTFGHFEVKCKGVI